MAACVRKFVPFQKVLRHTYVVNATKARVIILHQSLRRPVSTCEFLRETLPFTRFTDNILSLKTSYSTSSASKLDINDLVKKNKVVIFIKGVPSEPRCGFSNAVIQVLEMHGVNFDSYDVLADENLRQGIKEFSNWPTIPQVFINGQFVGGCDVLLQLHQSGELVEELQKAGIQSALLDKSKEK